MNNILLNRFKYAVLFLSQLFITLYLPVIFMTYSISWYKFNFNFNSRIERIGYNKAIKGIEELTGFLREKNELRDPSWTKKETKHLKEVKQLYFKLNILFVMALIFFVILFEKKVCNKNSIKNLIFIFALLCIIPFFKFFWREIFHTILFNNDFWKNSASDFSYYLMPRIFFRNSLIFIIVVSSILNTVIYYFSSKESVSKTN